MVFVLSTAQLQSSVKVNYAFLSQVDFSYVVDIDTDK